MSVTTNDRALLQLSLFYWVTAQWNEATMTGTKALDVLEQRGASASLEMMAATCSVLGWIELESQQNHEAAMQQFEKALAHDANCIMVGTELDV